MMRRTTTRLSVLAYVAAAALFAASHARASAVNFSSNEWRLAKSESMDSVTAVIANSATMEGRAYDDTFWIISSDANLNGRFDNDAWLVAASARLNGSFADHVRVLAQTVVVDGAISNGLWCAAISLNVTTNAHLHGLQLLLGDNLVINGYVEGNIHARGHSITLGGTVVGDVHLVGDDIVVRPGTTVIGDLYYATTNQSIVLDAHSQVSGELVRIEPTAMTGGESPGWTAVTQLFFFAAALLVGIPFILLFPDLTGRSVRHIRFSLWKCGLAGLVLLFLLPPIAGLAALSFVGLPLAFVLGATYGVLLYVGKFLTALAVGTALLARRGTLSLPVVLVALVIGLLLYYCMALLPYVGQSLQTVMTAFGTGSLILAIAAGRGRIGAEKTNQPVNPNN